MILNETVAAIADAIREKTGKSELIKPVDFATEIKGISAGGGSGESGGDTSNWRYFDYSALTPEAKQILFGLSNLVAVPMYDQMCILPSTFGTSSNVTKGAICWDVPVVGPFNEKEEMRQMSYGEMVEFMTTANGIDFASIPELTEAEFYNLSA